MKVKRIVANVATSDIEKARAFYTKRFSASRSSWKAGIPIEYGPATEPWGVRRFYVRDPFGKLINILQHE